MKVISQIGKFDGVSLTNEENISALDRNVFITDTNGNIINTLYNKIISLDNKTVDLNNLIYQDTEKENIYVKNSTGLVPNARIKNDGTLYIRKINIADSNPINTILEIEGVSNKGVFCWDINTDNNINTDNKFGLKNYYKNNLDEWVIPNNFIWNINYQNNNSFQINTSTYVTNGDLCLDRDDDIDPRIQIICLRDLSNDTNFDSNNKIGFRTIIEKDSNRKPIRFQYMVTDENNNEQWTNFLFKNITQRNVFFPEGIITVGSSSLEDSTSVQIINKNQNIGILNIYSNTGRGSCGFYDWSWESSDDNNQKTPWLIRYNPDKQLTFSRPIRIYENTFTLAKINYNTDGTIPTQNSGYAPYITMYIQDFNNDNSGNTNNPQYGGCIELFGEYGLITSNRIQCNSIYAKNNSSQKDYSKKIYLNSYEVRTFVPLNTDIPSGQTEDDIDLRYAVRGIPGTYIGTSSSTYETTNAQGTAGASITQDVWKRVSSIYTDFDKSKSPVLKVTGNYGSVSSYDYSTCTFYPSGSDIRLKENISNTKVKGLDIINKIQMHDFNWKKTNAYQKIGFIADELEQIDPFLASGGGYNEEGTMNIKTINTFYLQGYEVKAIQELSQQVNTLKQQIEELKTLLKNK